MGTSEDISGGATVPCRISWYEALNALEYIVEHRDPARFALYDVDRLWDVGTKVHKHLQSQAKQL